MKKISLFIFILIFSFNSNAQDVSELVKKAVSSIKNYDFEKAIKLYTEALTINPTDNSLKESLANLYMAPGITQNESMANKLYEEVFNSGNMSPIAQLKYANLLEAQKNFPKASSVFNNYSNKSLSANTFIRKLSDNYFDKIAEPASGVKIYNVEDINTKNSDFSPSYYKDGISYVSTRKTRAKTGYSTNNEIIDNFTDIFKASRTDVKNNRFAASDLLLKAANQKYMQGPMTFTDDYGVMYITRSISKDEKSIKSTDDNKTVMMEICKVNYSNGDVNNWDNVIPVVLNRGESYQNYSYAHPAFMNGKGDQMIFASNMPGGYGGTDLWYTKLIGTEWSTPVNLGPEINTAGEEMFPFVSKDGTLYFASSGLPGLGGLDIFKAKNLDNMRFGSIENLGAPYNSKFDDFAYICDPTSREGFFTSNRAGGKGLDDIYSWSSEETLLQVKVISALTQEPIKGADVKIPCLGTQKYKTDEAGMASIPFSTLKNCDLTGSADGYKNNTLKINQIQTNKLIVIPLEKDLEERCKFVIIVLDKATNAPIPDAQIVIRQVATNEEISGMSKVDGRLKVKGITMNELYEVSATKDMGDGSKYIGIPDMMKCSGLRNGDSVVKYIYLNKARIGDKFKIENIYYDLDKWFIRPEAAVELDKIVALMKKMPTMEIELGSHTDCRSSIKYNENLSAKRAAAAVEYITSKGIAGSRLQSRGYGESTLTNGCACEGTVKSTCSEKEHQANRRTEFTILKF